MAEAEQRLRPSDCNPGDTVTLRGKVRFSRVFHPIEGEELKRDVERARERGQKYPITTPYWKLGMSNVSLLPSNPTATTLEQMTNAERMIAQQVYRSTEHPELAGQYNAISKSPWKPQVFDASSGSVAPEIILQGELAADMDVAVVLEVFNSGKGNNGIGIQKVFLMEPVRYYRPRASETVSALGITVQPMSIAERNAAIAEAEAMARNQEAIVETQTTPAFAEPSPVIPAMQTPVYEERPAQAQPAQTIRTDTASVPVNPFDNSAPTQTQAPVVAAINPSNIPGL